MTRPCRACWRSDHRRYQHPRARKEAEGAGRRHRVGPGLWVGHWDAEAGHIAMPRVVWSSLATSWAKPGINHPLCPALSLSSSQHPLPFLCLGPARPEAWWLLHLGRRSALDGPWCPIMTHGVILHPTGLCWRDRRTPHPTHPAAPGAQDGQTEQSQEVTCTLVNAIQLRPPHQHHPSPCSWDERGCPGTQLL